MKFFAALALTLASSAVFAMPKVGDLSNYNGTFQGSGGGSIAFTQALQLTSFNAQANTYAMTSTLVTPNQTKTETENVNAADLLTTEQVADALANCPAYGGTAETIVVPAGSFATCKIVNNDGSQIWVAQVPFGIAKQISYDEDKNILTLELASFTFGQ